MTDLTNPAHFARMWDLIDDPKLIREAFEADQLAEDETALELYQAPDGEHLEVIGTLPCGSKRMHTGQVYTPYEVQRLRRIA